MAADTAVRLSFPAKPEYLLLARLAVSGLAKGLPFGPEEIVDLKLAVTEACGNVVRHAYEEGAAAGTVHLELVSAGDRIEILVEDHGSGIEAALPERPVTPSESGGMGLWIMRTVVDDLDIARGRDGRGTVVHMTKRAALRAQV